MIVDSEQQPNSTKAEKDQKHVSLGADTYESLIEQLPDIMRIALVLRDREGLSDFAIANHLRISETDVRRLLHQARMELRRMWLTKD